MPDSYTFNHQPASAADHPLYDRLPEYAAMLVFGTPLAEQYAQLSVHLAECAQCRADLDDLLEVIDLAVSEGLEPAAAYPQPDLSFLPVPARPAAPRQLWHVDRTTLVIALPQPILQATRLQSLAGVLRGRLLYRYVQEPGSVADLEVSIDVYAEEALPGQGRVRVSVEVPSRDPLEQAGSLVILRTDQATWDGETDELGGVDFTPVPLDVLPQMRVEITPVT